MIKTTFTVILVVSWMVMIYLAGRGNLLDLMLKILQEKSEELTKVGEWKFYIDDYEICATEFVCSHCRESFVTSELTDKQFLQMMKYCPHCGAKMDGDD